MKAYLRFPSLLILAIFYAQSAVAVTPGLNWKDSYSVNGQCYCDTTYDHETGEIVVATPAGDRTVRQICETIGPGPGADGNPIYNDVQCGNGPPNNAIDEVLCPGRVDQGSAGCDVIGPTWNLSLFFTDPNASANTITQQSIPTSSITVFPDTSTTTLPLPVTETPEPEPAPAPAPAPESTVTPNTETIDSTNNAAQTSGGTTEQPVGLVIAASDFTSKDNRWVLFDAQAPDNIIGPDPDGSHTNSALSGKYLELLPDVKVINADTANADSVWPIPGDGPQVHFNVNIIEAGTYAVYVRAFSTGEFDDTIHVGFDGLWEDTGANINTCGERGKWIWTQCDNAEPATLEIPTSGLHSIEFAARDDGFEFDQFVLQLLNDDGSTAVQPDVLLQAINGIESESEIASLTAEADSLTTIENNEPELGQAVAVGVGSVGFKHLPFALLVLLVSALCFLQREPGAIAKD